MVIHGCTVLHLGLISLFAVLCKGDKGTGVDVVINDELTELVLLHVVYRHGERTPESFELKIYPNNPNYNNKYSPYGHSALIDRGKHRLYENGKLLRNYYDGFINKDYLSDEILVTSTDLERTKKSARCCLAGLYASDGEQQWNCESKGQTIPLHIKSPPEDDMLNFMINCPRLFEARMEMLGTPEGQEKAATFNDVYAEINKHVDNNISKPEHLYLLNNLFKSEKAYGLPTPEWAVPYLDRLEDASTFEYESASKSPEIKKIVAGKFLDKIVKNIQSKISNTLQTSDRKMFMYSVHGINVAGILAVCGVFKPHQPPFGATFILEVRKKPSTNTHGIRILYMKDVKTENPEVLTIPECEELCPLEKFIQLNKDYMVNSTTENCKAKKNKIRRKEHDYSFKIDYIT